MKTILLPLLAIASILIPINAFADCSDVNTPQWKDINDAMTAAYSNEDYESAINYGKSLTLICDRMPLVNLILSEAYAKLGNEAEAEKYIMRSTEYLQEYSVPRAIEEKIWMTHATYKHPYRKENADLKAELEKKNAELEAKTAAFEQAVYNAVLNSYKENDEKRRNEAIEYNSTMDAVMWTGIGVASAGAITAIVGGALLKSNWDDANAQYQIMNSQKTDFRKSDHSVHMSILATGLGAGLAVTGTVMALIGGLNKVDVPEASDPETAFSIGVSTNSIQANFVF